MARHPVVIAGLILCLFAVAGSGMVAFTWQQTEPRIIANEREALLRQLYALVPAESIDNDIVNDRRTVSDYNQLGSESTTIYLGRRAGKPVAAVFTSVVPDGYSGPIKLLVAVRVDGTLGGVRVVSHKETPGLGDKIEERKSDWVLEFTGRSLANPAPDRWKVKRDGGDFDQFTGATITPRAIVNAVRKTLIYFDGQGQTLFRPDGARLGQRGGRVNGGE